MAVDVNEFRLEKARQCGIDHLVNPKRQDLTGVVNDVFGTRQKADVIFECAGAVVTMDMASVNENELSRLGNVRNVIEDFERAIELLSVAKVVLAPLITHRVDFEDYLEAYRLIEERSETVVKVMVRVNGE